MRPPSCSVPRFPVRRPLRRGQDQLLALSCMAAARASGLFAALVSRRSGADLGSKWQARRPPARLHRRAGRDPRRRHRSGRDDSRGCAWISPFCRSSRRLNRACRRKTRCLPFRSGDSFAVAAASLRRRLEFLRNFAAYFASKLPIFKDNDAFKSSISGFLTCTSPFPCQDGRPKGGRNCCIAISDHRRFADAVGAKTP